MRYLSLFSCGTSATRRAETTTQGPPPLPRTCRTFQVLASALPVPELFPAIHLRFNEYLAFDLNWSAVHAVVYILYYFVLEPTAAVRAPRPPAMPADPC